MALAKERASVEDILKLVTQSGANLEATPVNMMVYANDMAKAGLIKPHTKGWKDCSSPLQHHRDGS